MHPIQKIFEGYGLATFSHEGKVAVHADYAEVVEGFDIELDDTGFWHVYDAETGDFQGRFPSREEAVKETKALIEAQGLTS